MWPMKSPPKVKIFVWRACHDIIPTRGNLSRRHIPAVANCQVCGGDVEYSAHTLMYSLLVEEAWLNSPFEKVRDFHPRRRLIDVISKVVAHLMPRDTSLLFVLFWEVWNQRNNYFAQTLVQFPASLGSSSESPRQF